MPERLAGLQRPIEQQFERLKFGYQVGRQASDGLVSAEPEQGLSCRINEQDRVIFREHEDRGGKILKNIFNRQRRSSIGKLL